MGGGGWVKVKGAGVVGERVGRGVGGGGEMLGNV